MTIRNWTAVDRYISTNLLATDPTLDAVLRTNFVERLPRIDVSPAQGKFLNLLVTISGARNLLEIGTLGGYSTICMARALPPNGSAVTLEFEQRFAEVARTNIERAGLSHMVDVRVGPAIKSLPELEAEGLGPFDFIFIDADKQNNPAYIDWAVRLSHPGTVIVLDNVVRGGAVVDASSDDPIILGTRAAFDLIHRHPQLDATALQTVDAKGHDGFVIAVVR